MESACGLKVGDIIPEQILHEWGLRGLNFWNTERWVKGEDEI